MARTKRWTWSRIGNGFGEVKLSSFKYFSDFVYQEMLNYETYIWRGHRCDNWKLESTLDRLLKKAKIPKVKYFPFRQAHLKKFKYATRGRRGLYPTEIKEENEWWALGQHHGLSTPLLDWTTSPFVAAYFAFIDLGERQTEYRSVYAIHKPSVEHRVQELIKIKQDANEKEKKEIALGKKKGGLLTSIYLDAPVSPQVEFVLPLSDENQSLVNQSGLFSRAPDGQSLDSWVIENINGTGYTLIKILIPNKDRKECLKMLNRMNINHLTLFPDLYGASRFCNLFGEIEKY